MTRRLSFGSFFSMFALFNFYRMFPACYLTDTMVLSYYAVSLSCVATQIPIHLLFTCFMHAIVFVECKLVPFLSSAKLPNNPFKISWFQNSQLLSGHFWWWILDVHPSIPPSHLLFLLGCGGCESAPSGSWVKGSDVQFSAVLCSGGDISALIILLTQHKDG